MSGCVEAYLQCAVMQQAFVINVCFFKVIQGLFCSEAAIFLLLALFQTLYMESFESPLAVSKVVSHRMCVLIGACLLITHIGRDSTGHSNGLYPWWVEPVLLSCVRVCVCFGFCALLFDTTMAIYKSQAKHLPSLWK